MSGRRALFRYSFYDKTHGMNQSSRDERRAAAQANGRCARRGCYRPSETSTGQCSPSALKATKRAKRNAGDKLARGVTS